MKLGIVGLPNVGKSTLFNAITRAGAECANYPFCTIEPNVGSVAVPDERVDNLSKLFNTKSTIPAVLEFVDIAGLVKGAASGEGLGNKFLSHIREVDAIVHVVRCFADENITHVDGFIDPIRDIETINLELQLSDIEIATKRLDKIVKSIRGGDKTLIDEQEILTKIIDVLNSGQNARMAKLSEKENAIASQFLLLTQKPIIYCCNISENDIGKVDNEYVNVVTQYAKKENAETIAISSKVEEELMALPIDERNEFAQELGINESGLNTIIKTGYKLLGLISYLTAGEKEVRAWTIKSGTKAPQAAGKIHSDFEKGFIRAEVVSYSDMMEYKSMSVIKEKGKLRSEGKDYIVKDGDIILFRFNV